MNSVIFCFSGAIFEQGTDEVQSAFKFAMVNHNQNTTTRKFELQAFVDVINTADAYKLSRLSEYGYISLSFFSSLSTQNRYSTHVFYHV